MQPRAIPAAECAGAPAAVDKPMEMHGILRDCTLACSDCVEVQVPRSHSCQVIEPCRDRAVFGTALDWASPTSQHGRELGLG